MIAKWPQTGCVVMAELIWTVERVVEATGAELVGEAAGPLSEISTDSRTIRPGALFVALRGERFDGHDFLDRAWTAGAGAALVERQVTPPVGRAVLRVDDTLRAYGDLARWWRARHDVLVIAVTGSTGKTSTKELIAGVVTRRLRTVASRSSFNNEIGLPATLLGLSAGDEAAVLEIAMRGPGEIAYLASIARPDVGVITNVGHSHLGRLGSREAIAAAKGELLEYLGDGGTAVLNADDPLVVEQSRRHRGRVLWYGFGPAADVRADELVLSGLAGSRFTLVMPGSRAPAHLRLPGRHMVQNALAAAAVGFAAGLDADTVAAGLAARAALPQRQEVATLANGARVINDSYNAAPDSVRAALAVLLDEPAQRRVACLGDMLEIGEQAVDEHRALGRDAAGVVDLLIGVGELGAEIAAAAESAGVEVHRAADADEAGRLLSELLRPGDLVLLKASRAVALERALSHLERRS